MKGVIDEMENINDIIKEMEKLNDNYITSHGAVYITHENMKSLINFPAICCREGGTLITPYLINIGENGGTCEVYEYELSLTMEDVSESRFMGYVDGKYVSVETVDCFTPKAVIAKGDNEFFVHAIESYLNIMSKRKFENFRNAYESMKTAELYYQIF